MAAVVCVTLACVLQGVSDPLQVWALVSLLAQVSSTSDSSLPNRGPQATPSPT